VTYDLIVFEPQRKLRNRSRFLQWLEIRSRWLEPLDFNDVSHAPAALREWYRDMIEVFPPRFGSNRRAGPVDASIADYGIGRDLIHAGFDPSRAPIAYEAAHRLAARHAVGLFDVQRGEAWFPGARRTLELAHEGPKTLAGEAVAFPGSGAASDIAQATLRQVARTAG
jgi:hypothetical protein